MKEKMTTDEKWFLTALGLLALVVVTALTSMLQVLTA